eukprot:scaffold1984_cov121-Pinguiococcus_pyrenoidosus.AAC.2
MSLWSPIAMLEPKRIPGYPPLGSRTLFSSHASDSLRAYKKTTPLPSRAPGAPSASTKPSGLFMSAIATASPMWYALLAPRG